MDSIDLNAPLVLAGVLIPFVTALLTKWEAPDWVKGLVSVTLAAAVSVARTAVDGDIELTWRVFSTGFIEVWCTSLVAWLGLFSDPVAKVNQATGTFGFGTTAAPAVEPIKPTPAPEGN